MSLATSGIRAVSLGVALLVHGRGQVQRWVVIRQHMQRKADGVPVKGQSLFADDPDRQGWRYGAVLTDMSLPAIEILERVPRPRRL